MSIGRDAFSYKRGMRLPSRIITLVGNGVTNLTAIDPGSIKFVYRPKETNQRKEIAASVVDAALMKIDVDFGAVDTSVAAQYQWHVEATIGGLVMAWPEKGFYTFSVTETIEVSL